MLRRTAAGALFAGLPQGWVGGAYASDAPEVADLKVGMIALTDCAPFVIAREKGFFKKFGINATVIKGASGAFTVGIAPVVKPNTKPIIAAILMPSKRRFKLLSVSPQKRYSPVRLLACKI